MKINVFGDFVPIGRGVNAVSDGTAVDGQILSHINGADCNIVNLECPVVKKQTVKGILKGGPCLKTSENAVKYLKDCGFNMVTLANNHLNDYGSEGIHDTFAACEEYDMTWVGAGENLANARKPRIVEINGMRLGIINVCEKEYSIATNNTPGANPIDEINNYYDIVQLKKESDRILVIIHGGTEHYRYPTPRMKKRCRFYADLGVSAIICHHTHCYSGYEVYKGVPIFYSLGNFFFDRPEKPMQWKTGYFVQVEFGEKTTFSLYPYEQCNSKANVRLMNDKEQNIFFADINSINNIIADDTLLNKEYDKWLDYNKRHYIAAAETWAGKWYKAAYRRGLVPPLISKRNAMTLLNCIRCESHSDLMLKALAKFIEDK